MKKTPPVKNKKHLELENRLKRALADYQNLKKRNEKDKKDFIEFATASVLDKFLSVFDNLERAQAHLKDEGLKIAIDQFVKVLNSEGVEEIKLLNTTFDPNTSDCTELVKGKKNQIIKIIKKGYTLNSRVLRPAQVKVGKGEK